MRRTVLVTGANGYIGEAVARAFARAGWRTYGLVRRAEAAEGLAREEIHPVVGAPGDLSFLDAIGPAAFDAVVSNTEDRADPAGHFGEVGAMLDEVVRRGAAAGLRPLAMFSSGCKDYGPMGEKHGDAALAPQTEASPLDPPAPLAPRCGFGSKLLDKTRTPYDAIVLRPTIVYGRSSSHYGGLFDLAAGRDGVLTLAADPDAVMHSCHVDDCADAYVRLAEHADRGAVANRAYNISNSRYETARQIGEALARSYGLKLSFERPGSGGIRDLFGFWQWVGSERIRDATGWRERRASFADGIDEYRIAFEAHRRAGR